jgi:hypothetical protein
MLCRAPKSLPWARTDHQMLICVRGEVLALREAVSKAQSQAQQTATEDPTIKDKRAGLKKSLVAAKKMLDRTKGDKEVGWKLTIERIESQLKELQPKPQAPALRNQLLSAQVAADAKKEERAKVLLVKERQQAQVEELQQSMAKMDRTLGKMDAEIVELNHTVIKLAQEVKSSSADLVPPAQPSAIPEAVPDPQLLQQIIQMYGIADTPEQMMANLKKESTGSASTTTAETSSPPSSPMAAEQGGADKGAEAVQAEDLTGTQAEVPAAVTPVVVSHRGPTTGSVGRRQVKAIPTPTLDKKAAPGRAVAGLERQERLRVARVSGESDPSDAEEEEAIKLRQEEELDQQSMP